MVKKKRVYSKKSVKIKSTNKKLNHPLTSSKKQVLPKEVGKQNVFRILNYMLLSLVISLGSFILFKLMNVSFFQNLFYLLTIISFFVSIGFLISLLVYLLVKFFRNAHLG